MKTFFKMTATALVFSCAVLTHAVAADTPDFSAVDSMINRVKNAADLPSGTAVILVKGDDILYEGYFGYSDIGRQTRVDDGTVFYIASSTKPFFALNLLLKAHAEKLDTMASLQSLFPGVQFKGFDADEITIRDLLVHTSGVDNNPLVWATAFSGIHDAESRKAIVADSYPNEEAKHGIFDYTNVGYNILSVWADEAFDARWQDQLHEEIFKPLGMNQTSAYMSMAFPI